MALGLLKIIQPTPPSLREIILSLCIAVSSNDSLALQALDLGVVVADLAQHLVGVLALRRRVRDDVASACG